MHQVLIVVNIGILHPGAMGISVAASAKNTGCQVFWVSEGRSSATRNRAREHRLVELSSLSEMCEGCEVIASVCPPHAADAVLDQVLEAGFKGIYLDANAIAPQRAQAMAERVQTAGGMFVDGGIIGGPAWKLGETWLYLSGLAAEQTAGCFAAGPLETCVLSTKPGDASALKMVYAAWNKGNSALLCAVLAAAHELGVWPALKAQWERDTPGFPEQTSQRTRRVTAKAWRFVGEMDEIAATFETAGLPGGFHRAAAEIFGRMAHFKDNEELPGLAEVMSALAANASNPDLPGRSDP